MNLASNASGTTNTTMTYLDDHSLSSGGESFHNFHHHNGSVDGIENLVDSRSLTPTPSNTTTTTGTEDQRSPFLKFKGSRSGKSFNTGSSSLTSDGSYLVYNYKSEDFERFDAGQLCEHVCTEMCRKMGILPTTRLLFGICLHDTAESKVGAGAGSNEVWTPLGEPLESGKRYAFRMRYKMADIKDQLRSMDANAYEYLYRQMRNDMERDNIPEIKYPLKKDNVMGLGVVNMYIDLKEQQQQGQTAERIEANYKRYLPPQLVRAHRLVIKSRTCKSFSQLRKVDIDADRLKWNFVNEVNDLAPNYLMERYLAAVEYVPNEEGGGARGRVTTYSDNDDDDPISTMRPSWQKVSIQLFLHDAEETGLKIAPPVKDEAKLKWIQVAKLEQIYVLKIQGDLIIELEIEQMRSGYRIKFDCHNDLVSFSTYLAGYIRLTTKWMMDICETSFYTPSLKELAEHHVHGPIGREYSVSIIREKCNKLGSWLLRQSEKEYDVYHIDMNTKKLSDGLFTTETFKVTKSRDDPLWRLHLDKDEIITCQNTKDLAHSLHYGTEKFRLRPSAYDKPPLLLICLPKKILATISKIELSASELQHMKAQIFNPLTDLAWHQNSTRECDNGTMTKVTADWTHAGKFKETQVTLKVLNNTKSGVPDFLHLANTWHEIDSPHLLKMYGLTISKPFMIIMEYAKYGPLNEFLALNRKQVDVEYLKQIVLGLVRALVYLRNRNIVHGNIRCCNLYVTSFQPKKKELIAKLGDPGLRRSYSEADLPWVPFEYHKNYDEARSDHFADYWAFATTVWEIFSYGQSIKNVTAEMLIRNYNKNGAILEVPDDWLEEIRDTIMDGWSKDPFVRFKHGEIFGRLDPSAAHYTRPMNREVGAGVGMHGNSFKDIPSVLLTKSGKIKRYRIVGKGHYGVVYLGQIRYNDPNKKTEEVAMKSLKTMDKNPLVLKDFEREINIMQSLDHPNVVRVIEYVDNPSVIVMEYLSEGSILEFLNARRPDLTNQTLLNFAYDIANGMNYLRMKNIIHRDLAARNILKDGNRVKISDFGLAQHANNNGYYFASSSREVPIKWYSPEAIKNSKFSFQSDVWSYGITLHELFSRGEMPNLDPRQDLSHEDFLTRLQNGDRLPRHELCPEIVYRRVMLPCWHDTPKKRPSFQVIMEIIESIQHEMNGERI